jgi:DNA-binding response OmpR family regulator
MEEAPPPRALVVEDDESISHLLVFILQGEGFKVDFKPDGKEADRYIHSQAPPNIVVLDINLPDIDGFGLLRLIRARPAWELTPILMLTSMSHADDVARAVAAGANDYLLKPFHPAELVRRVNKLCGR